MKLTDIIPKQGSIIPGKNQVFIAHKDFLHNELQILKDSLIHFDGKSKVEVNQIGFGLFQESNVPILISHQLPEDEDSNWIVDRYSSCQYEITKLPSGSSGTWHNDHFHQTPRTIDRLPDVINCVKQSVELNHSGVYFSSLYYSFDINLNSLSVFISTKSFELKIKNKTIKLPEFIEVAQNEGANKDFYYLRPLDRMEYFGISFKGDCWIDENGIFWGDSADEFLADIFGNSEINKITITKGTQIMISHDGIKEIELFNDKLHKVIKYAIKKCD
jgi:hypothetical protein